MRNALLCLGLLLTGFITGACGQAEPALTHAERSSNLLGELDSRSLLLDFELAFDLNQAGEAMRVLHSGELAQVNPELFRMDAVTEFRMLSQLAGSSPQMQQIHAADGRDLWVENRLDETTTFVVTRSLQDVDFDVSVNGPDGVQQLSPLDVHPLRVLRASLASLDWRAARAEESVGEASGELWVADQINESDFANLPHLRSLFAPQLVRLNLNAESGLPQRLQLIDGNDQLRYEVRFLAWTFGELGPGRLDYTPPLDVQVIRQAPAVDD